MKINKSNEMELVGKVIVNNKGQKANVIEEYRGIHAKFTRQFNVKRMFCHLFYLQIIKR